MTALTPVTGRGIVQGLRLPFVLDHGMNVRRPELLDNVMSQSLATLRDEALLTPL